MKGHILFIYFLIGSLFLMLSACGGGGGGDPIGYGELAIAFTDAKPSLPVDPTNFYVTITEVLAHGKGGWESLPLPQDPYPYTIDLMQFSDGVTTELVPPVLLRSGKYTQIRLVLEEGGARIIFDNDGEPEEYTVVIPSENLKTDKNIDFDVESDRAVDLLIDFDLSQSLVVTDDGSETLSYKLKPVLHIVDFFKAATISGEINSASIDPELNAIVTVFVSNSESPPVYEEYTKVEVPPSNTGDSTPFSIFWLVPNKDYRVEIDFDYVQGSETNSPDWCENVNGTDLQPGADFLLNGNGAITPTSNCSS